MTYSFEIKNNGPSNIQSLDIQITLPIYFVNPVTLRLEQFIYNNNNNISMRGTYNNEQYDVEWLPNNTTSNMNASTGDNVHHNEGDVQSSDGQFSFPGRSKRVIFSPKDKLLADVPANRITYLDCKNLDPDQCVRGKLIVANFKAADAVIAITLNFTIDMETVGRALDEKHDFLVIKSFADLIRTSDKDTFVFFRIDFHWIAYHF